MALSPVGPHRPTPPREGASNDELIHYLMERSVNADAEHDFILDRIRFDRVLHLVAYLVLVVMMVVGLWGYSRVADRATAAVSAATQESTRARHSECEAVRANADAIRGIIALSDARRVSLGMPLDADAQRFEETLLTQLPVTRCSANPPVVSSPTPAPEPTITTR